MFLKAGRMFFCLIFLPKKASIWETYGRHGLVSKLCFIDCSGMGFPGGSLGKESAYNARHPGRIPGSRRSLGGGKGHPLQYSCLGNPMDRGAWWATILGLAKSQT